jgi:hypothetical protein
LTAQLPAVHSTHRAPGFPALRPMDGATAIATARALSLRWLG